MIKRRYYPLDGKDVIVNNIFFSGEEGGMTTQDLSEYVDRGIVIVGHPDPFLNGKHEFPVGYATDKDRDHYSTHYSIEVSDTKEDIVVKSESEDTQIPEEDTSEELSEVPENVASETSVEEVPGEGQVPDYTLEEASNLYAKELKEFAKLIAQKLDFDDSVITTRNSALEFLKEHHYK